MHAPIILHIFYVIKDNNLKYQQYLFTVIVNVVISSFISTISLYSQKMITLVMFSAN